MAEHKETSDRRAKRPKLSYEEKRRAKDLEQMLFGGAGPQDAAGLGLEGDDPGLDSIADFVRAAAGDRGGDGGGASDGEEGGDLPFAFEDRHGDVGASAAAGAAPRRPAWEDPDDGEVSVEVASKNRLRKLREREDEAVLSGKDYEQRLRQQHSKLNPRTKWASLQQKGRAPRAAGSDEEEEEAEEAGAGMGGLLQRAGGLLARGPALAPGLIEMTRLKDANQADPAAAVVQSVAFHPNGRLLLAAGLDRRLRLFDVDGAKNASVQSVFLEDMPVRTAAFAAGGVSVVAAGRRKFFYVFDLAAGRVERVAGLFGREERSLESFVASPSADAPVLAFFGKDGHIPLVSLKSRQAIGSLKMNGTARSGAFSASGTELLTSGGDGTVYVWDLRTQRCRARYSDEGSLGGTALACSGDDRYFATGSSSGVVNIYRRDGAGEQALGGGATATPVAPAAPKPLRSVMNLTTSVDSLAFSSDSQVLAIASRMKRDSMRLVHLPSGTVFSNWPTSRTPLHYVHSMAFSPGGGLLAVGNAKGRVLLYRLHHYSS